MFDLIALPAVAICAAYAFLAYKSDPLDLVAWAHVVIPGAAAVLALLAAVF